MEFNRLTDSELRKAADFAQKNEQLGDTFFLYDEAEIIRRATGMERTMEELSDDRLKFIGNFFAVKALPNPSVLRTIVSSGGGLDLATTNELKLIQQFGLEDATMMFTATNARADDYVLARKLGAVINVGNSYEWQRCERTLSGNMPKRMGVRINPGDLKTVSEGNVIGNAKESQFGTSYDNAFNILHAMKAAGVKELGIHMMLGSNELNPEYFLENATIGSFLEQKARGAGLEITYIDVGGGYGVAYRKSEQEPAQHDVIKAIRTGLGDFTGEVATEFGRHITGPAGYLISRVTAPIDGNFGTEFVSLDGSVNNVSRLVTVKNAEHPSRFIAGDNRALSTEQSAIGLTGRQCSGSDLYLKGSAHAPNDIAEHDISVIEMMGAHARSNSTNYNLIERAGEVYVRQEGTLEVIRRTETTEDLFATFIGK